MNKHLILSYLSETFFVSLHRWPAARNRWLTLSFPTLYTVRKVIRIPASQSVRLILWLDGEAHDLFCIFRELSLTNQQIERVNNGTLTLTCLYHEKNMHGNMNLTYGTPSPQLQFEY